ncbi:DNA-binding transcriptional activator PspC [Anaerohalosphaera lusitana]|uniref:DNA-binding transcriptional activator PspC n=1 Tax=Anaerohalosphaera lusitana TaxID=1936003 RepID=A0A1U9NPQ3_9BACT|nr:PspC domain-containing protein [Anaerohalosphaera lusitana]AQT69889.1 DNA-binding transcriptional activator PspC [Anaerohalosphaera lusitana]
MRKLYLSRTDRKVLGVCGGIGETYDIDPTLVRLIVVFAAIITGFIPVAIMYIVAWAIIPDEPKSDEGGVESSEPL